MSDAQIKPLVLVFAGPNGSGKTTVKQFFDNVQPYTNADDIVAATGMDNHEAAKLVTRKRYASIEKREDFSFETVLSSCYNLELLKKAKAAGYFIKCVFVLTTDPHINISRVRSRVQQGGHDVEKETIIKRYNKSLNNLKELFSICDILHVYDNSGDGPVRIIRKHKEDFSVFVTAGWSEKQIYDLLGLS